MKTSIRIICLLLTLTFTGAMWALPAAFASDHQNQEAAETLFALGILEGYDDGDFRLDKVITRAEFTTLVARALGLSEGEGESSFTDVPQGHWAAASIEACRALGLISGYDESTFGPDDPVLFEQAVKVLISALGYDLYAEAAGGYPVGYISVANSEGLLKKTSAVRGQIIRRGVVVQLIFNALTVDIVEKVGFGETVTSVITPGVNLLSRRLNIVKGTGVITATGLSRLTGAPGIGKNEIEINGEIFHVGESNAKGYLGYAVTYYARMDAEPKELVYVRPTEGKNMVYTIPAEDILANDSGFSVTRFVYEDERGNKRTVSINPYADYIYNGVAESGFLKEDLNPRDGYVTLLDNDLDGIADVVIVTEYETIVAGLVGGAKHTVSDLYDQSRSIDLAPGGLESEIRITKNGSEIDFSKIVKNDVLSVAKSKNTVGTVVADVIVSSETITGVLNEKSNEGSDNASLIIDGNEYPVDEYLASRLKALQIGTNAKFYLTASGKIADFSPLDDDSGKVYTYGYLITAEKEDGMSDRCLFKVLTQGGVIELINGADRISVDGEKPQKASDVISNLSSGDKFIKYALNGDGEIYKIDTAARGDNEGDDSLTLSLPASSRRYISSGNTFGDSEIDMLVDNKTMVFIIPNEAADKYDDEKYMVTSMSHFVHGEYYTFEAYDLTEGMFATAVVMKADGSKVDNYTPISMVTGISEAVDNNGDVVKKITVQQKGNKVSYLDSGNTIPADLVIGEFVRLGTDIQGRINEIKDRFNPFTMPPQSKGYGGSYNEYFANQRITFGYVAARTEASIVITYEPTNSNARRVPFKLLSSHRVTIFDVRAQTFTRGTINDIDRFTYRINPDARAVVLTSGGSITDIILMDFGS